MRPAQSGSISVAWRPRGKLSAWTKTRFPGARSDMPERKSPLERTSTQRPPASGTMKQKPRAGWKNLTVAGSYRTGDVAAPDSGPEHPAL